MNVLVSGGGTIAPIDDVRYIANVSSGRFSASISEACLRRGARVWHVHTPTARLPFRQWATLDLYADDSASEYERLRRLRGDYRAVRDRLELVPVKPGRVSDYAAPLERIFRSEAIDVAFMAMAVSDYEPEPVPGKIDSSMESVVIRCRRTPKVIRSVRDWAPNVYLVGFKLLSRVSKEELIRSAEAACRVNRADLTVANELQTLRDGRHTVHLVRPGKPSESLGPSDSLADLVVERVFEESRSPRPVRVD